MSEEVICATAGFVFGLLGFTLFHGSSDFQKISTDYGGIELFCSWVYFLALLIYYGLTKLDNHVREIKEKEMLLKMNKFLWLLDGFMKLAVEMGIPIGGGYFAYYFKDPASVASIACLVWSLSCFGFYWGRNDYQLTRSLISVGCTFFIVNGFSYEYPSIILAWLPSMGLPVIAKSFLPEWFGSRK